MDDIATLSAASLDPSSGLLIIDAGSTLTVGTGGITAPGTVEILGTLVVNSLALPLFGDTILMKGGTLQGPDGGSFGDNTTSLTGSGFVRGGTISGTGIITASGGTLAISNAIASGTVLTIDSAAASDLLINGTAISDAAITLDNANQTLEIGAGGALTVTPLETVSGGTLELDSSASSLLASGGLTVTSGTFTETDGAVSVTGLADFAGGTDTISNGTFNAGTLTVEGTSLTLTSGTLSTTVSDSTSNTIAADATINLGGGTLDFTNAGGSASGGVTDDGALIGMGTVKGTLSGTGIVEASGGPLDLTSNVGAATGLDFQIDGGTTLQIDGTIGADNQFTFNGATGDLAYNNANQGISENLIGLNVGTSGTVPTNLIDFKDFTVSVLGSNAFTSTGATVSLSDGSFLDLSGITGNTDGTWFIDTQSDGSGGTEVFASEVVCYASGTRILTAAGEKMVETLSQGDFVLTVSGEEMTARPVTWIGRRRIDIAAHPRPETVAPVRIQCGAFADNMPHRDLLLSPDHAIFVDGKLICARQLINGSTIRQEKGWTSVEYFHVELDEHAILVAEGLPAESYLNTGNRGFFANSGEPLVLHPDLTDQSDYKTREAASCVPFVSDEGSVRPIWLRLAERAAVLGQPAPILDTTSDPELRIVVNGRTLRPIVGEAGKFTFVLPRGTADVRLVSRAGSPTDARPWLDDRRQLGVRVTRIVLRGASEFYDMPVDHPDLSEGWWLVERDGVSMGRWTDGEAVLPLPAFNGAAMLEVRLGGEMTYLIEAGAEIESGAERQAA